MLDCTNYDGITLVNYTMETWWARCVDIILVSYKFLVLSSFLPGGPIWFDCVAMYMYPILSSPFTETFLRMYNPGEKEEIGMEVWCVCVCVCVDHGIIWGCLFFGSVRGGSVEVHVDCSLAHLFMKDIFLHSACWIIQLICQLLRIYSGFRLMGPPVKRVSSLIGPLCQKQTYDNVLTILCLIGSAA